MTSVKNKMITKMDGWINVLTGLGIKGKDKGASSEIIWVRPLETPLEELFAADAMARKIVEKPVDEAFKKGYKILGFEPDQIKLISERARSMRVDDHVKNAGIQARLYGGAAIVLVTDGFTNPEAPRGPKESLKAMNVLHRFELYVNFDKIQKDLMQPNYGQPEYYMLQPRLSGSTIGAATSANTQNIHYSRLIRFEGLKLPNRLRVQNSYWADSVLTAISDSIRNFQVTHASTSTILQDFSVAIFKIKGLADKLSSDNDSDVIARMQIVNLTKSIARAVVVDADGEDFDYKTRNVSGIGDLVQKAEDHLVAETDMPHTVLFGSSPSGMGGTGNHEMNNWYNYIKSEQNDTYKPKLMEIYKIICVDLGLDSSTLDIEFESLYQLDEKEEAEVHNLQAQADQIYLQNGVLDSDEVAQARFGSGKYSLKTELINERGQPFSEATKPEPSLDDKKKKKIIALGIRG